MKKFEKFSSLDEPKIFQFFFQIIISFFFEVVVYSLNLLICQMGVCLDSNCI